MYLKHFLVFALLTFSLTLHAQKKKKRKKDRDFEVIEFDDEGYDNTSNNTYNNLIIKTSPATFLFGNQPIEVEKYITDFMSVQAGVGLTFEPLAGKEYSDILRALEEDDSYCESDVWANDRCDDYLDYEYRRYKPGFLLSGSVRLFFDSDAMDGSYFAMKLRYSTVNLEVQDVSGFGNIERNDEVWLSESVKRFDIMGHYGYQTIYDKLTAEYFVGLGARLRNESRQDIGFDNADMARSAFRDIKESAARVEIGIRIGFQL